MAKPTRANNLRAVSKEIQEEIKELHNEIGMLQIAFQLMSNGMFSGQNSGNVLAVMKWLDGKHTPLHARLMKIAPPPPAEKPAAAQPNGASQPQANA